MKVQYGYPCLSQQQAYEWSRKFRNSVTSVADASRPGQAYRVVTPESIAAVEALFHKVSARWGPQQLTPEFKRRVHMCEELLQCLEAEVRSKRCGLLTRGVLLQHDNAQSHTTRATVAAVQDLHFECLPHLPYSPDLTPSDYHMFGPLKEVMGGKRFRSDEEVQQAVHE
ncbi:uncharacterized protein LOC111870309 [Cryptotermes secundus]|uniref:uncharacterized protein LOC111870309 n=1 Tax=Cryptotermes secundus TaxID=105785 RepID=UPI000CD7B2E7|nr:uncharacterized protein LOC111870309 [Cryptotermes secundus]